MSNPTQHHLDLAYHILSYVIFTQDKGLTLYGSHPITAYATANASYANHADKKSYLGFTIHIGNNNAATYSHSKNPN